MTFVRLFASWSGTVKFLHPFFGFIFALAMLNVADQAASQDDLGKKISKDAQQDLSIFKAPTNALEAWRIVSFEVSVGKYDIAAEFIKMTLDFNPQDKDWLELEKRYGLTSILNLRNVERWSRNKEVDAEARKNVEKVITSISEAVRKELSNPERIRKYVNNLVGEPEEVAWAIKELKRSGIFAMPVIVDILQSRPTDELKAAIYETLPKLDAITVAQQIAFLDVNDWPTQLSFMEAIRKRSDYIGLTGRAETDIIPTLWHLSVSEHQEIRKQAGSMLQGLLQIDPTRRDPEKELIQIAEKFYNHKAIFTSDQEVTLWKWDGKVLAGQPGTIATAEEYYGLRFAKWALEIKPDDLEAQSIFLSLALERHFLRAGLEKPLAKSSPTLYSYLSNASHDLLANLLERNLREQKSGSAYGVLQVIGDRSDKSSGKPDRINRLPLLVKALAYPDKRVQIAAADALLQLPGEVTHGSTARIVDILREALSEDKSSTAPASKPKALLGKPNRAEAEEAARLIRKVGFDVDVVLTGRDLMRKLNQDSDYDLLIVDQQLPNPPVADLVSQLRADARVGLIPLVLIAIPNREREAALLKPIVDIRQRLVTDADSSELPKLQALQEQLILLRTNTGGNPDQVKAREAEVLETLNSIAEKYKIPPDVFRAKTVRLQNYREQLVLLRDMARSNMEQLARPYKQIRVIGELLTLESWQQELSTALSMAISPTRSDAERRAHAKLAMEWLRKIALGQTKGYTIDPKAEFAIRQALQTEDLASLAIDAVGKLPSKAAQEDLANVVLASNRPAPLRQQAADQLIKHIQTFGKVLGESQIRELLGLAGSETNPEIQQRLQVVKGILSSNAKVTGQQLQGYSPAIAPKEGIPEEPKEKEKEKEEKEKDK